MEIRLLDKREIEAAMKLVKEVFFKFEAPEYSQQGIDEFLRFIEPGAIAAMMDSGELALWGCFDEELLAGVAAAKNLNHISLLFVRKDYHRRGIARSLFNEAKAACAANGAKSITVNSSPYAVEAYRRLGFAETGEEQTIKGIRFTPMVCEL